MAQIRIPSPITGTVWKIVVKPGDAVGSDEPLIIFESMKMEIPLAAPESGRVTAILVREGDAVEEGDPALVFEIDASA